MHLTVEMLSMEDQALTKGRNLTIVNSQKKRIVPDIILHTKNVMIPIVKPLPTKQSYNIPFSKNRPQILKAQNYRNNPALLFSETPSHTLYNQLEDLCEVKRIKRRKIKNQNTKYTVSEKTNSTSVKKIDILQSVCSSERLSFNGNNNTQILNFPNTTPVQSLINGKESRSIKLSRKYNLSQMKESHTEDKDKFVVIPKIEMSISDIISKPQIVSFPSESFYDIADTVSTVSTLSASSFNIENRKTFANTENRTKLKSKLILDHLHSSNSECEISVLHYENDISPGNKLTYPVKGGIDIPTPPYSKSFTNCSSTQILDVAKNKNNNEYFGNKETATEENHQNSNLNESIRAVKYSWQAINDWMSPSQKREYRNSRGIKNFEAYDAKPRKIKYSWQAIGTSTQTSYSLLENLLNDNNTENRKSAYKMCSVKYSWQIIGISAQASLHNCDDPNYWSGILLTPNKNYNENNSQAVVNETDCVKSQNYANCPEERLKRCLILNNQQTQTFAEKNIQVDASDRYTKYSWHNLLKQYLL